MTRPITATDEMSNAIQRSRSIIVSQLILACQLNQSPVCPVTCWPLRHATISTIGKQSGRQCKPARMNPIAQRLAPSRVIGPMRAPASFLMRSCSRTISAEKASTPSTPQPKVWQIHRMHDSGTKMIARSRNLPSRASRSHKANIGSAQAIDSMKFTKPNWNG